MRWTIKTSRKNVFSNKKTFFNIEELRKLQTLKMMAKKSSDRRYQQQFKELWQFCYSKIIKGFMKNAANEKLNAKQSSSLNTNRRLTRELFEFPLHWVASGETVNLVSTFVVPEAFWQQREKARDGEGIKMCSVNGLNWKRKQQLWKGRDRKLSFFSIASESNHRRLTWAIAIKNVSCSNMFQFNSINQSSYVWLHFKQAHLEACRSWI